jgi:hypothetical protein
MARSHLVLRALMALASLGLVACAYAASGGLLPVAAVLVALTVPAVARPESWAVLALLLGHAVHWTASAPVPDTLREWLVVLVGAWLALLLHVCASAAATWPSRAPAPRAGLVRWAARTGIVALAVVPVWAVSALTRGQSLRGEVSMSYVAVAGLALLGGTVLLLLRAGSSGSGRGRA